MFIVIIKGTPHIKRTAFIFAGPEVTEARITLFLQGNKSNIHKVYITR